MAAATTLRTTDDCESCILCSDKYDRIRPSFCQCKHCSIPLCLDCMKEHHDEILQNVAELSHQYNELQELLKTKQNMIVDETTKTIHDVNHYFDTYITELRQTQQKIIEDLQVAKQDAQNDVERISSDLHLVGIDIQALAKESIVQTTKMKNLSTQMKTMEQQLNTYHAMRTDNLIKTKQEFSIKFHCSSITAEAPRSFDIETNKICETDTKEPSFMMNPLDLPHQPVAAQEFPTDQQGKTNHFPDEDENLSTSDDDTNILPFGPIFTSYKVDRMASDGNNILYTSYDDKNPDLVAYCLTDNYDDRADKYRDWKQSRITDMIWWDRIEMFICATKDAIYTVDYMNGRFKTVCAIPGKWSYVRVAANSEVLSVWMNPSDNDFNGINVYSNRFEHIKTIDFNRRGTGSFIYSTSSFCMTNDLVASICMRTQNNRKVFQANFCDRDMNKFNSILLGGCNGDIEIRTDGKDRFFITTGQRHLHIVSSKEKKRTIMLQNDGDCIAVLDNRRIAISHGRAEIELLTY